MKSTSPISIVKKILLAIVALLATVLLAAVIIVYWYYPKYQLKKEPIQVATDSADSEDITIMSYNLRYWNPLDLGKKSWFYRAPLMIEDLEEQAPVIIGFQEVTRWHYKYLVKCLPQYDSTITYRDDTLFAEGCPIFYHTDRFTLVDQGSFWLSETPEVMSKDWGSSHYRVCGYVILTDKQTGENFVVFNTHLDHVSDEARINGIQVVLDKIAEFGGYPSLIMGDFNALEGSETYISVTEHFNDAMYVAEESDPGYTYQNWGNLDNADRIDYFMLSKTGFKVNRYEVLDGVRDGVYTSDHCPIVLNVTLE